MNCCDLCGKKTDNLVDYFAMLCPQCKAEHTDIALLRKIGQLQNKIEDMQKRK